MGRLYPDDLLCDLSVLWVKNAILVSKPLSFSELLDIFKLMAARLTLLRLTSSRAIGCLTRALCLWLSMGSVRDSEGSPKVDNDFSCIIL